MDSYRKEASAVQSMKKLIESNIKVLYPGETGVMVALCYRNGGGDEASIVKLRGTQAVVLHRSGESTGMIDALGRLLYDIMGELNDKLKVDNPELDL